jgi:hypothetical protein
MEKPRADAGHAAKFSKTSQENVPGPNDATQSGKNNNIVFLTSTHRWHASGRGHREYGFSEIPWWANLTPMQVQEAASWIATPPIWNWVGPKQKPGKLC